MSDRRNPVRVALTSLAMRLLASGNAPGAEMVAKVLDMYEKDRANGEAKPRRRSKSTAVLEDPEPDGAAHA